MLAWAVAGQKLLLLALLSWPQRPVRITVLIAAGKAILLAALVRACAVAVFAAGCDHPVQRALVGAVGPPAQPMHKLPI